MNKMIFLISLICKIVVFCGVITFTAAFSTSPLLSSEYYFKTDSLVVKREYYEDNSISCILEHNIIKNKNKYSVSVIVYKKMNGVATPFITIKGFQDRPLVINDININFDRPNSYENFYVDVKTLDRLLKIDNDINIKYGINDINIINEKGAVERFKYCVSY